jgi:hypothetical protein
MLADKNNHQVPETTGCTNRRKREQFWFAIGLLMLWLLVFLAVQFKIIK